MHSAFSRSHPVVNFCYFALVLAFSMCFMHPVSLLISLTGSILCALHINGAKALRFNLCYMLPLMLFTMLINCLFNHQGVTTLTYLPDGNSLTLESILYGVAASVMLVTVINWFSCVNTVMTSDKIVYLFGRILPALSLIFAMILRFVPRFKAKIKEIAAAQHSIGLGTRDGNVLARIRHGVTIFSIMVTWALENAIDTSDAMKSRGYGLAGRSAFSIYRFDRRDGCLLAAFLLCGGYIIAGGAAGGLAWLYYPICSGVTGEAFTVSIYGAHAVLCAMPLIVDAMEDRRWRATTLKI